VLIGVVGYQALDLDEAAYPFEVIDAQGAVADRSGAEGLGDADGGR
jgi:hypothetical protein